MRCLIGLLLLLTTTQMIAEPIGSSENIGVATNDQPIKYGYINQTGEFVIEPKFDYAYWFSEGLAAVKIGTKWGFINKTGEVVIEPKFESGSFFGDGLAETEIEGNWLYIDTTGEKSMAESRFLDGLALVKMNDKFGYMDKTRNIVIQPQFDEAETFSDGVALVLTDDTQALIDKQGRGLTDWPYQEGKGLQIWDGIGVVHIGGRRSWLSGNLVGGKWMIVSKAGKTEVEAKFDDIDHFSEGLAQVTIGKKFGYIDTAGKLVIQPKFDEAGYFHDGVAIVRVGRKHGVIDKTGKFLGEPQFDWMSDFVVGLAVVFIGSKSGVVDKTGKLLFEPLSADHEVVGFHEELVIAVVGGRWDPGCKIPAGGKLGFFDMTGKLVVPGQFDEIDGDAVKIGTKWGFIDKAGKVVIKPQFDEVGSFSEGLAAVRIGENWGFINKAGEVVIKLQFDKATDFHNGLAVVGVH